MAGPGALGNPRAPHTEDHPDPGLRRPLQMAGSIDLHQMVLMWASVRLGVLRGRSSLTGFSGPLSGWVVASMARVPSWACREGACAVSPQEHVREAPALLPPEKGRLGSELGGAGYSLPGGPVGTAAPLSPPPLL